MGTVVGRFSDLSPMLGWALQDAGASSGTLMTHWLSKLDPDGIFSLDCHALSNWGECKQDSSGKVMHHQARA